MASATHKTYSQAGVNINLANRLIKNIGRSAARTSQRGVVSGVGGFAAVYDARKRTSGGAPLLVASTDGVGTKVELARLLDSYRTIGIDLVAMSVNDLITVGAVPLFFLDYFATGKLRGKQLQDVIHGIVAGCNMSDCSLIGGETAEMPGVYPNGAFDLAGFAVGCVKPADLPQTKTIRPGDVLLGLASSGVHSNGYSLVRKVFSERELKGALGRLLLRPTRIYVKPINALRQQVRIKGLAHITGGGFYDNIPRVLPKHLGVVIDRAAWPVPVMFRKIQAKGRISDYEMFRTFNMGIGMAAIISPRDAARAQTILKKSGVTSYVIGTIARRKGVLIS